MCLSGPRSGRGWKEGRSRGAFLRCWNPGRGPGAAPAALKPAARARQSLPYRPPPVLAGHEQAEPRGPRVLLIPAEESLSHRGIRDGAGRGAEDAGPAALRRRGRRGWEGAGREVVPGARPRMLAAPAAAAALGAAPGLGRSLRAPLGPFAGNGDARSGRGLGRAVPACAA